MGLAAHPMGLVAHTIGLAALLEDGQVLEFLVMTCLKTIQSVIGDYIDAACLDQFASASKKRADCSVKWISIIRST
jgi:hypothetical protein